MIFLVYLFWISFGILFYCYIGYGIIVYVWNRLRSLFKRSAKPVDQSALMPVTLIISAYNEGDVIRQKLENTRAIDYPAGMLKIIFVTDGSVDGSDEVVRQYPGITLLHQPERKGKYAAIKRAMQVADTPVVVFSDANTMLNKECIRKIVLHYSNKKVGGVAGEKKILNNQHVSAVGEAEGLYWQYESLLKRIDAGFYTVVGAAGELFSIRRELFTSLDDDLILDDFIISMQVCLHGYKIEYEPGAFATEPPSASLSDEAKRKVRISAGAYQSIGYLSACLNFFKYPLLSFQYVSRRLLRWVFCPLMLIIFFISNACIVIFYPHPVYYDWVCYGQLFFYGLAMAGWLVALSGKRAGVLTVPFYFVFMNYCLVKGFVKYVRGRQTVLWEKSLRQAVE